VTSLADLGDGLVRRDAGAADVEAIVALEVAAFGPADEPGVRAFLTGPGSSTDRWTVVVDTRANGQIVSASARLPMTLTLDGLDLPATQIEYVATDPAYQRRGLVRAQFDHHHERSRLDGRIVQVVGGIPYLYRRFGYGYGISYPDLFVFDRAALQPDPAVTLRPATEADLPAVRGLEALRERQGLHATRDDDHWRRWLAMAAAGFDGERWGEERFFVAERDGAVVGWSKSSVYTDERRLMLLPSLAVDAPTTDAIIAHALDQGAGLVVVGHDTPDTVYGERMRAVGAPAPYGLGLYIRIADPVAFLDHLRPVLSRRLAASRFADATGTVEISLYERGLAIGYDRGVVTDVHAIPGVEDPFDDFECGVAPDWFPALVLGRWGAKALDARTDDVSLGRHAELLETLFPAVSADLVGDL
jgi:predicted N-acetyltransferase YhbS